jgi:hypothetical protein
VKLDIAPDAPLCSSGKRPFRTEEEATKILRAVRWVRHDSHAGYRPGCIEEGVYRCRTCSWWHLTSSNKPRRRKDYGARARRR